MKLVDLLAKELREWPSGAKCMTQNSDASAVMLKSLDVIYRNEIWVGADGVSIVGFRNLSELAADHATAIVTRAQWEAEKARIAGKVDGGWIRHKGVNQPVADWVKVEIRTRGGDFEVCSADGFAWGANGAEQIMAYRIHNPVEQPAIEPAVVENVQAFNAQAELLYDPVAQGPLAWRDRIRTLDTQRAELEATYQRQIGEIAKERGGLVQRLAGEGLALVEVLHPVEDMSDPFNWKPGDLIECLENSGGYTAGSLYTIKHLDFSRSGVSTVVDDKGSTGNGWGFRSFKWHSRPGK